MSSDRPIERVLGVLDVAKGPDRKGEYIAFCIAHNDQHNPNLHVGEDEAGNVLVWCSAGCSQEQVLVALGERGVGKADLFANRNSQGGGRVPIASKPTATLQPCTLEAYSEKKKLPIEWLREQGLSDVHYAGKPAVRIVYFKGDGTEGAVRFRLALEKAEDGADNRFRWRKSSKPLLYGLWRLGQARDTGYAVLVEGESDAQTLWYHGFPALGIPGATNWRNEWASELEGIEKVYAVIEPDHGGETLWDRLAASPISERLYRVTLEVPDGQD
jgi:putative DNA primase/helicase